MSFCPKCGTQFDGNFCPKCGTSITGAAPAAAPAPAPAPVMEDEHTYASRFTGGAFGRFGVNFACTFVSLITLGLAFPAMFCWKQRWYAKHTILNGRQIVFDGKGGQLFGNFIKWVLLTIVTLGIYYILKGSILIREWEAKHTHFEGVTPSDEEGKKSRFTGKWYQMLGVNLLTGFVTIITLSFGMYWAHCYKERWFCKHTEYDGHALTFSGTGMQYFGKKFVWMLLTGITFGIYYFWLAVKTEKWTTKHTHVISPATLPVPPMAGALPDYAD